MKHCDVEGEPAFSLPKPLAVMLAQQVQQTVPKVIVYAGTGISGAYTAPVVLDILGWVYEKWSRSTTVPTSSLPVHIIIFSLYTTHCTVPSSPISTPSGLKTRHFSPLGMIGSCPTEH